MDANTLDHCDARAVAPYVHTLTEAEHIEVVDTIERMGGVTAEHAEQLRELIREARKVKDLDEWVRVKCSQKKA